MNKQSHFVFLPTEKKSQIHIVNDKVYFEEYPTESVNAGNQHLYILSNDEIKEEPKSANDRPYVIWKNNVWVFDHIVNKQTGRCSLIALNISGVNANALLPELKKIIATTNPELIIVNNLGRDGFVPSISQSDIEHCIALYNQKNKSDKLKVFRDVLSADKRFSEGDLDNVMFGYELALQDNADKKFNLDDMRKAFHNGIDLSSNASDEKQFDVFIQSLAKEQPKSNTVMVEYELTSNRIDNEKERYIPNSNFYQPKLDKDGNIVIVRK